MKKYSSQLPKKLVIFNNKGEKTQDNKDINVILENQRMKLFLHTFMLSQVGGKWKVNFYG